MLELSSLLSFAGASWLLCLAPGPDNSYVVAQSATRGARSGILITLGLCCGLLVHTAAVTFGLATLLNASPMLFSALQLLGACYLLYLAWLSFSASKVSEPAGDADPGLAFDLFKRGILMNISNPKVSVFFLAFLPQFVSPDSGNPTQQLMLLGLMFMLIALLTFSSFALLASGLGQVLLGHTKAQQSLNRLTALMLALLAISMISSAILPLPASSQ